METTKSSGLKLTIFEETPGRLGILKKWLPRIGVAALFFAIGLNKFAARSEWVGIFARIGFGQWFRYFTGAVQATGALLVLIPRTFAVGILMIACTMLGAMGAWSFFLGAPHFAMIPGALLLGLMFIGGEDIIELYSRIARN